MRVATAPRFVLALLSVLASPAIAACPLLGTVAVARLPAEGVEVVEHRLGAPERVLTTTGADGGYSVVVAPLDNRLQTLTVVLRKAGFENKMMLFVKAAGTGCPEPARRYAELEHVAGTAVDNAALPVPTALCAVPSVNGRTIYLAPYKIFGAAKGVASDLNGDLPSIVHHRILAFQTRLARVPVEDVSVETICQALSPAQGEQIRRVGTALNALAVIAGEGELNAASGSPGTIALDSVFRVQPRWRNFGGTPVQIGDAIPAARLRPSRVADQLTDLWGKQAVLALALRRLAASDAPAEAEAVKQMLIELRKTMQPEDPLMGDVRRLLTRLGAEDVQ